MKCVKRQIKILEKNLQSLTETNSENNYNVLKPISEPKEIHVNPETNTNPTLQNNHFYLLSVNTTADIVLHEDESPVTFYTSSPNISGEEHENTSNAWPNNIQENDTFNNNYK